MKKINHILIAEAELIGNPGPDQDQHEIWLSTAHMRRGKMVYTLTQQKLTRVRMVKDGIIGQVQWPHLNDLTTTTHAKLCMESTGALIDSLAIQSSSSEDDHEKEQKNIYIYMYNPIYIYIYYIYIYEEALSGLILDHLNLHSLCHWNISPLAALAEVHHVSVCKELLQTHKSKNQWNSKKAFFWWSVIHSDKFNWNTIVCHPCGFHYYLFSNQKRASVENKMCFVIPAFGGTGEGGIGGGTGEGGIDGGTRQGGSGPTDFVFALLDWESQKSNFCATWAEEIYRSRENAANDPPCLNCQQHIDIYLENPNMQHRLLNPFKAWNR